MSAKKLRENYHLADLEKVQYAILTKQDEYYAISQNEELPINKRADALVKVSEISTAMTCSTLENAIIYYNSKK